VRLLVVDDERPALEDLVHLLRTTPGVREVRGAHDAKEALALLAEEPFDGLFLDVRMPGIDGLELARVLRRFARPPAVVFVSAHQTAASDAFEVRALDYLMKPVSRARIEQAVQLVAHTLSHPPREAPAPPAPAPVEPEAGGADSPDGADVVPVDNVRGGGTRLVARTSILYLQAHGDYVRIVADEGRFLLRGRLSDIERRWEPFGFTRVHRGYVVNLRRAVEVRPLLNGTAVVVFANGSEVPIARRQVGELRRRLRL
jgi:DNA-binding LytR/AlgR family response regulator